MPHPINIEAYDMAQEAITLMKGAIMRVLAEHPEGLKGAHLGRCLGTNADFIEGQEGWFHWTVLKIMEMERVVEQPIPKGPWKLTGGG